MAYKIRVKNERNSPKLDKYFGFSPKGRIALRDSSKGALTFEDYNHKNVRYLKVKGGKWDGYYLSTDKRTRRLGLYFWAKTTPWRDRDGNMFNRNEGGRVSYKPRSKKKSDQRQVFSDCEWGYTILNVHHQKA